jgi:putative alpha-1,2-mannosidase
MNKMNRCLNSSFFISAMLLTFVEMFNCTLAAQTGVACYVDPFIGTAYTGHTSPAATTPFGMVQLGPDNGTLDWEFCSGYHDKSKTILIIALLL